MKLSKLITERRTVHSYLPEEVPQSILDEGLRLASHAPNHKLTFPFLFIIVGKNTRKKIAEIAFELKGNREPIKKKYLDEGSLIFAVQKLSNDELTRKEDYATMACAIQNFCLYLWDEGFGTKWSSGKIIRDTRTYNELELNNEEYEIVGVLWAGKFSSTPKLPDRPKLDQFVRITD